jgi:DNA-binding MarR family transcriptional regulator
MLRNRTTVKVEPGLFLRPHIVAQLVGTIVQRVVDGSRVTASEFALTSWLNVAGPATPSELAEDLGISPTTVSAMIDRLVRKGEVQRVRHPGDGRSYRLEPTVQGRATHVRNGRRLRKEIDAVAGNLDGDPADVLAALQLLETALRKTLDGE